MKYIMFKDFSGDSVPVIFPNRIGFDELREQMPYSDVLSAGYVQLRGSEFYCHGQAKSINAKAGPNDAGILAEKFAAPES